MGKRPVKARALQAVKRWFVRYTDAGETRFNIRKLSATRRPPEFPIFITSRKIATSAAWACSSCGTDGPKN